MPDLPTLRTDRPITPTAFRNLVAWNLREYKSLFPDYPFLQKLTWPHKRDFGLSIWEVADVVPANGTFDFFALPMPQGQSSKIVFASTREGHTSIFSMSQDGTNLVSLANDSSNNDHPRWSPNGTMILFQSDRDNPETGNYDIYVMNADGSGQTRLTFDSLDDCNAVWSSDGSKIGFQSLRNGLYYQVYVMNADGTSQVNVTNGIASDTQPSWSPDGTKIAFASERAHAGRTSVYVMNANGSNQTRLTFTGDPFRDEQPVWSRDGTKLAFVSTRDSVIETWQETDDFERPEDDGQVITRSRLKVNKEVYLMNADGSNQLRLTNVLEADDDPYWSPDGTKIIFRSDRERDCCDPTPQLWTMNADGSNQTIVTSNVHVDYSPSWTTTNNQPPVASSGGPYTVMTGQAVQFNGSASFDPDGSITSYSWNFGDNNSGSGVSPSHVYTSVGTYTVTLTVRDNNGSQSSITTTATVNPRTMNNYGSNFSQWALLRQPNTNESLYWNDIFRAAYQNGQGSLVLATREFGRTLFESSEYAARNRSDHDYVYDLYKTYLMREPDQGGWDGWTAVVPLYGREHVRRGFDESVEFLNIVGTMTAVGTITSAVSSLASARVDPKNQPNSGLLARDAEWSLPLLSLPGRAGLDLGLSLSYSSMVWTRSGPYLYFDEDIGSPSPGFRLGFPTIQEKFFDAQVGKNVYVMITSSGSRVELRQVNTSNVYETGDSSYLQLIDNGSLLVRSTDGTQLSYSWFNHEFRCKQIKDRNGNYLTVNYNWLGDLTNITDTLARVIAFNYDGNANLISITQTWSGQTHTWATFGWGTQTMQSGFSGVSVVGAPNGSVIPVLTQVGMHDGTRHTFEYTTAGQISIIRSFRSDNLQRAYTAYDYQLTTDDCPRLSATRLWAENWTGINGVPAEVVTHYHEPGDGSHQLIAPDGTTYKEFYGGTGGSPLWQQGLVIQSEVWSGGVRQKWTTINWTQDNTALGYQSNPRVTESNIYDAAGNRRRVTIDYGQYAQYGLPYLVREYAADGVTEIRHNFTDYNLSQGCLDRRIIGLVSEIRITDGTQSQTKITYGYDDPAKLQAMPTAATQHDGSYSASFTTRGNVTSVSRWDVTDITNASKALTTQLTYNTAGAVVASADPLGHQNSVSYGDSFSDGNNGRNTFAYRTTLTDADGFSSFIQYNFDFGAQTRLQGPPPGNQPQGLIQAFTYDGAARLDRVTTTNNGAYRRYVYGPNYVQSFASVNNIADEAYLIQVFDGSGRVTAMANNHPGSVGGYSGQNTIYDLMGRTTKQSNPTEINSSWLPAGDDAAGWLYTQQTYDWQGRPLVTTNSDGTTKEASYSGCGCSGGEVATLTDEVGRRQKIYSDVLGRQRKTEVLNWNGSVHATSTNTFNARDQLTLVRQWAGAENGGVHQDTNMGYDGYGRLQTRHLPEQAAGTGTVYAYNADDTIQLVTDARGASAAYNYNHRHLVTGISYSASSGVTATAPITYSFDAAGNRISMTDGLGNASYAYDQLSRLASETRTFSVGSYTLSYAYNFANDLTGLTDAFGGTVNYAFDNAGRVNSVGGSGYGSVSQFAYDMRYRAWGRLKSLAYSSSRAMTTSYNSRMQVSLFQVSGQNQTAGAEYQYYQDGRISYSRDLADGRFDRAYTYDNVARLTSGFTGAEARGANTPDGPYKQTYGYDGWGNLNQRTGRHWSQTSEPVSFAVDPLTNRNPQWQYDAGGDVTAQDGRQYIFDAAGRQIRATDGTNYIEQEFDGDGLKVKRGNGGWVSYYLRSTALRGAIIAELNVQGQMWKKYVYSNGQVLAEQLDYGQVNWKHRSPNNNSEWVSLGTGVGRAEEYDPAGTDVGTTDPYIDPDPGGGFGDWTSGKGIPTDLTTGCSWEGMSIGCDYAFKIAFMRGYSGGRRRSLVEITQRTIPRVGSNVFRFSDFSDVRSRALEYDPNDPEYLQEIEGWSQGQILEYKNHISSPTGHENSIVVTQLARPQKPVPQPAPTPTPATKPPGLPPCIKNYLSRFFDSSMLAAITWSQGIPSYVPMDAAAFTLDDHIYFGEGAFDSADGIQLREIVLIGHETAHVGQYRRNGSLRQKGRYLFDSAIKGVAGTAIGGTGLGWTLSYYGNKFEKEAFEMTKRISDDLAKNGNPCP